MLSQFRQRYSTHNSKDPLHLHHCMQSGYRSKPAQHKEVFAGKNTTLI